MLFQIIRICFNASDHVTLHCLMKLMAVNGATMTGKTSELWFLVVDIWLLSEKGYCKYTITEVVAWLSCSVYIFAIWTYLTMVNQLSTIFFNEKLYIIRKISIRWFGNNHKTIKKGKRRNIPTVNPLFK